MSKSVLNRLFSYRVTVQLPEGRHQTVRRAAHPIDAGLAVLAALGFDQPDAHHPPLAMFVVQLTGSNGGAA